MKKCFSFVPLSFVVNLFFAGSATCSQWPQWMTSDTMKDELIESGFTPCIFEAGRVMTDKEVDEWFDTPRSQWNLGNILKNLRSWHAGKSRIERFFDELKHPNEQSLEIIHQAIFEDDEMRYALDPETGLPPIATLMVAYLHGSEEEKKRHKAIFEYLLEVETSCSYNLEHQAPLSFNDKDLDDLKSLYLQYHENDSEGWQGLCDRLKDQPNTLIRLQNVAHALSDLEKPAVTKNNTKQQKQSAAWNSLLLAIGAAVGYGLYRYATKDVEKKPAREHTAEYAQLFKGV